VRPRKTLSQSFLHDPRVAAAVVRAAGLDARTDVLEVGPGLGAMTGLLAARARRVVAVEIDPALADALRSELAQTTNVEIVTQDVLAFEPSTHFSAPYTVVANLPYHITSPVLRHLLGAGPPFAQHLVVMVQAEVADRLAAPPGQLSALAVTVQVQAHVRLVRRVPAAAFYPRPKVDSAVLALEPMPDDQRAIARDHLSEFTALVHAGFKQPRKTLANSLADGLATTRTEALQRLQRAGIDPGLRPQALAIADWVHLFQTR
jgi:16S rRNA (adenine1518-N6/adenine1519-N6)-dimethyltransferase